MVFYGKKVVPDSRKRLVRIGPGDEGLLHFQWLDRNLNVVEDLFLDVLIDSIRLFFFLKRLFLRRSGAKAKDDSQLCSSVNYYINRPFEFLDEEDPDASTPFQVFEDMLEDNISLRTGNLVVPNLGAEVTSSSRPVKLEDLQRILSNIGGGGSSGDPDEGLGLGDILKPDLIMPLNETLPLEEGLTSHLPEGHWTLEDILDLLQSPPFRQQVLRTRQIDLSQVGINPSKSKVDYITNDNPIRPNLNSLFLGNPDIS
ncbi:hypothetical protein D5086_031924 [Populus alba]|uniref:Uncharacterized protein n=1 Tax=Populus alba TaxID=43335 RepID=A0ACC4AKL5_POPAL